MQFNLVFFLEDFGADDDRDNDLYQFWQQTKRYNEDVVVDCLFLILFSDATTLIIVVCVVVAVIVLCIAVNQQNFWFYYFIFQFSGNYFDRSKTAQKSKFENTHTQKKYQFF